MVKCYVGYLSYTTPLLFIVFYFITLFYFERKPDKETLASNKR